MPLVFLIAASILLIAMITHYTWVRGWKWALIYTGCALFFGLWHELNPLREADPEYHFAHAITVMGIPPVGVIGWMEIMYLSWFLVENVVPSAFRSRIMMYPVILVGISAAFFSLCVESTGIAMGWWIWREDRQHILYPMAGWGSQAILFSSLFFALFHSTLKTKIMLLGVMILTGLGFSPWFKDSATAGVLFAISSIAFVVFARFDPKSWAKRNIRA